MLLATAVEDVVVLPEADRKLYLDLSCVFFCSWFFILVLIANSGVARLRPGFLLLAPTGTYHT